MTEFRQIRIPYGVKLIFADGTAVNWYRDSRRRTVYAEKNPQGHVFPRAAERVEEILGALEGRAAPQMQDDDGRPIGAFDGGADPNPGPGSWAVVLPDGRELTGVEPRTTNNRMELTSAIRLLEATRGPLRAIGDSRYVIEGITRWIHGWRQREWKTVTGKPVENRDLWEELARLAQGRRILWERVAGHRGHPLNERCDRLCVEARRKAGTGRTAPAVTGRGRPDAGSRMSGSRR
jgi:ribonuclease HI